MGAITMLDTPIQTKTIDGHSVKIDADVWLSDPGAGVSIYVTVSKDGQKKQYSLIHDYESFSEKKIQKLADAINYVPEFREQLETATDWKSLKFPKIPEKYVEKKIDSATAKFKRIKKPKFKDFLQLKSGRDKFSSMKFSALSEQVEPTVLTEIRNDFEDETNAAKALRWHLRGLSVKDAIHKINVDLEVAINKIKGKKW